MVLVSGHGPFTWGRSGAEAVFHSVMLEEMAKIALLTLTVNPDTPELRQSLISKHYSRKHGPDAYYGQQKNKDK
jgi:L-ribulose-5-phosphate 4-epimerase